MLIDAVDRFDIFLPHEVSPALAVAPGLVHDFLVGMWRTNLDFIRKDHEDLAADDLGVLPVIVDDFAGAVRPLAEVGAGVAGDDVDLVGALLEADMRYNCGSATSSFARLDGHSERIVICNAILCIDGGLDVLDGRTDANDATFGVAGTNLNSYE